MYPKLQGGGPVILDEITPTLWAYINVRPLEKPLEMDRIKFSPEAAELFAREFLR
jgi:hypothetical protein